MSKLTLQLSTEAKRCYIEAHGYWMKKDMPGLSTALEHLKELAPDTAYLRRLQYYKATHEKKWISAYRLALELLTGLLESDDNRDEIWRTNTAEAWAFYAEVAYFLGEKDGTVEAFLTGAEMEPDLPNALQQFSNGIFAANSREHSAAEWQEYFRRWRVLLKRYVPESLPPAPDYGHNRLRIGYLSADLHIHPIVNFLLPLLEKDFDSEKFEVFVYSIGKEDGLTQKIKRDFPNWRSMHKAGAEEVAKQIRSDEIDILMELGGHCGLNQLPVLAFRPAPVQLLGLGYMGSSGMHEVDYVLGDAVLDELAEENEPFFTEKLLILPGSHFCFAALREMPEVEPPPCLKNGYITFGCMNNFSKVSDEALKLWGKLLTRVHNSHLFLKHKIFDSEEGRSYTLTRMERLGVDTQRVIMQGFSEDYLLAYHEIDIALDTFPYTGGLTTCETVAMGVPVVTRYGKRHGTRFSYSLLKHMGLEELCAATDEEYFEKAEMLARDTKLLQILRGQLRKMFFNSPVCDRFAYRRQVEKAFLDIWQKRKEESGGKNN